MYRLLMIILSFLLVLFLYPVQIESTKKNERSIIVEVDGSSTLHKKRIINQYPSIEVVATYDVLFQGLALKGDATKLATLTSEEYVKGIYPVETYQTLASHNTLVNPAQLSTITFPSEINPTPYTGKGVKVAVIDTGIDYEHPDLKKNYQGGFDLVDLDDSPMETKGDKDLATYHGTHVAGIIAADGELKGVAPDSEIYAYRALGPGGFGTSIQVIAAMEEAIKEGVDVINLSLGNIVNGPDYPTSKAVNTAVEQGVAVIVANGNAGPENWTVGAPATASKALSVGALQSAHEQPYVYEGRADKKIGLTSINKFAEWGLDKDYQISDNPLDVRGKIGFITLRNQDVKKAITEFMEQDAIALLLDISNIKNIDWFHEIETLQATIPIALVSEDDKGFILNQKDHTYYQTYFTHHEASVANFSSRGPVTVNWMMKPDILAPGVNIISTVPSGYTFLNGTSMAAPHVTGAIAVMKEAQPDWTNEQIFGALKTTAVKLEDISPTEQGAGNINLSAAIESDIIIDQAQLSFGKVNEFINERTIQLTIENMTKDIQSYHFNIPKKEKGLTWDLPQSFEIGAGEKVRLPIKAKFNTNLLKEGIIQGWLDLEGATGNYSLPYIAVNKTADYPRVMGFDFTIAEEMDGFSYSLYVSEEVQSVTVKLYNPITLNSEGDLWKWTDLDIGMNEGTLKKSNVEQRGNYYGIILVENANGEFSTYETEVHIPE